MSLTPATIALLRQMKMELNSEDSDELCIWKVLNDGRERNQEEIAAQLTSSDLSASKLNLLLTKLYNDGLLNRRRLNGANIYVYSRKIGVMFPQSSHQVPATKGRFNMNTITNLKGADPLGTIIPAEGLDVCIWKATHDYKRRCLDEVGDILAEYGFSRETVKDRVVFLANKGWYDRQGRGKNTRYTLRKHIPMPKPLNKESPTPTKPNSTTTVRSKPVTPVTVSPNTIAKVEIVTDAVVDNPVHYTIRKEEGMVLSIWKAMADYHPYTPSEVGVLLSAVGFNYSSVGARMSDLYHKGWFDREPTDVKRTWKYTLRRNIPMPCVKNKSIETPAVMEMVAPITPSSLADVVKETTPDPCQKSAHVVDKPKASIDVTPSVSVNIPLVELVVKLKGVELSRQEVRSLVAELTELGFATGTHVDDVSSSILDVQICIKGQPYTKDELIDVTQRLITSGFGK